MMTYLLLNTVFMVVIIVAMRLLKVPIVKRWYIALVPLLLLTAVFDPVLIHLDIFDYTDNKILGVRFFGAPIEDFMYSLLAVLLVPSLWNYLHQRSKHD